MLLFDMAHGPWMFYKRQIIVTRPTAAGRRRSCVLLLAARSIQELVGSSGAGIRFIEPRAEARNRRQPTRAETARPGEPHLEGGRVAAGRSEAARTGEPCAEAGRAAALARSSPAEESRYLAPA